jgi:hypothetical protein
MAVKIKGRIPAKLSISRLQIATGVRFSFGSEFAFRKDRRAVED